MITAESNAPREGPVPLTHTDVIVERIQAPIARVWAVVSDHGSIGSYVERVVVNRVEGRGVGAVRYIANPDGELRERLETLDSQTHSLSYSVVDPSPLTMTHYLGIVQLAPEGDGACRIMWSGRFATGSTPDPRAQKAGLEQFYRGAIAGLQSLLAKP